MVRKFKKNICSIIAFALIVLLLAVIAFIGLDSEVFVSNKKDPIPFWMDLMQIPKRKNLKFFGA